MDTKPTYEQAQLHLQIYDMRREARMRQPRDWFFKNYFPQSFEEAMRKSQRAWVAFRDADCKELAAQYWAGGTGTTSAVLGCMTEKTVQRTKELKDLYTEH